MERNKSFLMISFLLGAALGAAVGYMLASGKSEDIAADINDAAGKIKDELGQQVEKGKEFVQDLKKRSEDILKS